MLKEKCIYCGRELEDDCICECQEREEALQEDFLFTMGLELDLNEDIGVTELLTIKKLLKNDYIDLAYTMYKLGVIRGHRAEQRKGA